jgi:hypothetical protein
MTIKQGLSIRLGQFYPGRVEELSFILFHNFWLVANFRWRVYSDSIKIPPKTTERHQEGVKARHFALMLCCRAGFPILQLFLLSSEHGRIVEVASLASTH